ncbi:MAG: hypothetical protein ACW967_09135 [Candidatus Hodarchaeales archaeon]|jgi:hypothetical protein
MERSRGFIVTLVNSFFVFVISFIIFLPILDETNAFGTIDPQSKVEPVAHFGGLMGYSFR